MYEKEKQWSKIMLYFCVVNIFYFVAFIFFQTNELRCNA